MKTIIAIVALSFVAAVLADNHREVLRQYSDACKAESGVSDETLTKIKNREHVDDPKLKTHAFCILKKAGFQDEKGQLQIETIKTKLTTASSKPEAVSKFVAKCAIQKDTPEDTASHFFTCLHEVREHAKAN